MADVRVRYFAAAADAAGRPDETLEVPGATVGDLRAALVARYGEPMERVLRSGSILVDGIVSRDPQRALGTGADVLPRFSGG
ncbi:MoaD/ThiS family protein [Microbacterium sp.]|uniref:MoaD/ThiS family protein n=1 Tax=Microbacterium sp. TaxID=51671 RepID=UPI002E340C4A|nr:MoaD/ThiS family protein [Microbacterium sp.]HEX5730341.1 MoaD/ThiS family protein [Microbacterium sp.]